MVNTCVSCGNIIPEGMQVCHACMYGGYNCPDCGALLHFMCQERWHDSENHFVHSRIYHCENCLADWELDVEIDSYNTDLKRKVWG